MLNSYYILLLKDKKRIIDLYKKNIYFFKIKYYKNSAYLYVDDDNYLKILKYFKLYDISLYKIGGFNKLKKILIKYQFFIYSIVVSLIILFVLSNTIFDVIIMSDNSELVSIVKRELDEYNLSKYRFVKSYNEKEKIKENILKNYKDKIEWLEIDRVGTKYYIRLLERKINNNVNVDKYQNIIAKKNAVITEIKSSSGEIIKKINDYVNKGEVIISGKIIKNDEIKNIVRAEGTIYGETWYNVKVHLPLSFRKKKYTGNSYNVLTLSIFDKRIHLFNKKKYHEEEYIDKNILSSRILPFSLNSTKVLEVSESTTLYTYDQILQSGMTIARERLESSLPLDAKILSQKKLKLYQENNIIVIEVFFKVYENITDYEIIEEEGE